MPDAGTVIKFYSLEELQAMSEPELAAVWDNVPTERQRAYKTMYEAELRQEGVSGSVGSDQIEKQVLDSLLQQYRADALVPAGGSWVHVPQYLQDKARKGEEAVEASSEKKSNGPKPAVFIAGGVILLLSLFTMLGRGSGKKTVAATGTMTRTPTATLVNSPTPTPLALENQDNIIRGGDHPNSQNTAYAVNLQIQLPGNQPRVFVVQPRSVKTAQWDFDNNPDTASYLVGMAVRPIVGIPYSDENAAFFDKIGQGTTFALQMNTGAVLRYQFVSTQSILRSDTSVLRQIGPGLVLILIGQMDDTGVPTASRPVVIAAYLPDQELSRDGVLVNAPEPTQPTETATPIPTPVDRVDVEVVSMTSDAQSKSMSVALRVFNARQAPMTIGPDALWITLGYAPHPLGPRVPAEGLKSFDLLPGQAVNLTVSFPWNGEPYATVGTDGLGGSGTYQYSVQLKQ